MATKRPDNTIGAATMQEETKATGVRSTLNPRSLELTLYPTEKCNFRCSYCYETFEQGRMPATVVTGVRNLIDQRIRGLNHLHLAWFGGEPLLAQSVIHDIAGHAAALALDHGVDFNGSMTTNGYLLTPDVAARLCRLQQNRFQISLDGPAIVHDLTRRRADGSGSFTRIWRNLKALRDSALEFNIALRIHANHVNLPMLEIFCEELAQVLLVDSRFSAFIKPVQDLGGPQQAVARGLHVATAALPVRLQQILRPPQSATASTAGPAICYASRPNALAIRADGRVQKCTVLLEDERNTVGRLAPDGSVNLNTDRMNLWARGYQTLDAQALRCPASALPTPPRPVIPILQVN